MARVLIALGIVASLVIAPKFVFSRSQHTKAENTPPVVLMKEPKTFEQYVKTPDIIKPEAEKCDLIFGGSTRYESLKEIACAF